MWAQRLVKPSMLERVDVAPPRETDLGPGKVLLRTLAGGICGSDLPKFRGQSGSSWGAQGDFLPGPPGFPMHEVVGEVLASRHPEVNVGARVVGWAAASDALAEYVVTDGSQVYAYDSRWPPRQAVLIQSLACVLYAVERLEVAGKSVAVIGLGPIGMLFAHALKERGAGRVTGIDPVDRTSVSACLGIDQIVRATSAMWAQRLEPDDRPEVTVEAVGHQTATLEDALVGTAPTGTILYFGIPERTSYPVNMEMLVRKNLTLVGGVTRERRRSLAAGDHYFADHPGLYEALVWHEFGRETVQQAYETAAQPGADRLKVVLDLA